VERQAKARVLIAGGGVAALEAALALGALARELVEVELVAPETEFVYRPLLVAEPFGAGQVRTFPLSRLVEAAGARLRQGIVTRVDPEARTVRTAASDELPFDLLLLAPGAIAVTAIPGAVCFRGPADAAALAAIVDDALAGAVERVAFAVPSGSRWALPAYELALLTRARLVDGGAVGVRVVLVTPEDAPLELFGPVASSAIAELLEARGIELVAGTSALGFGDGRLTIAPGGTVAADRVVALPRLEGPRIDGVFHDSLGFIATDSFGQVVGETEVWAAGDATRFPVKQGGVAAQQADAAAEAIAARAGAAVAPAPFRPVLRGLLLTGMAPRFLRAEGSPAASFIDAEPLWWPPGKIVGRHLAPFLAEHLGLSRMLPDAALDSGIPVEVELTPSGRGAWSAV
jgi:sulfide:quinone oxidoreductase